AQSVSQRTKSPCDCGFVIHGYKDFILLPDRRINSIAKYFFYRKSCPLKVRKNTQEILYSNICRDL
ncbi:MAG TPA: hypothetical protein PKM28_04355, partial [Tenuifilaceae bacterium]|nr:hypothetical protein [Tenuifilaceae bacterium]